jgi:type I restriction enzyme, S subunit
MNILWPQKALGHVVTLQRGFDLPSSNRVAGDYPIISSGGISGYHIEAKVKGPGVVTGRYGSIGEVFFVEGDYWPLNTTLWVKDFHKNHEKFVYYLLGSLNFKKFSDKTGVPGVNRNDLHKIKVHIPSISVQKKIVDILSTCDQVIEKNERLITTKEKLFSGIIKSMISNQCDRWEHLRADKVFKSISDKNNAGAELLSVTQDRGVIPRTMLEGRVMSPEGSTDSYKLIKKGDFAISLRSFQGGIEYSRYQGLISPAYTVLRPKLKINNDFYRHFFKSYLFIEKYLNIAVIGIRDGKQISIPDFITVKIPFPPLEIQKSIAEILNTAQQEIDLLRKQTDAYRKQKCALMKKLLTGLWRVNTEGKNG